MLLAERAIATHGPAGKETKNQGGTIVAKLSNYSGMQK
jgi:hypothetical protein